MTLKRVAINFILLVFLFNCNTSTKNKQNNSPYLVILGIAQDGGYPQAGTKESDAWDDLSLRRQVVCLGIVDPTTSQRWMIDATPDFKEQLHSLDIIAPNPKRPGLAGIFLTHAHIGHYTGLMNLGREVMGAKNVPVYAMPRMYDFIQYNGPWDLLVRLNNIALHKIKEDSLIQLNENFSIKPILVPHRAEYTETVGYIIYGPNKKALFIPDIDKWKDLDNWGVKIEDLIAEVDFAFLDGTFYEEGEIPGRLMSEIPHPFIEESISRFENLPKSEKDKIYFIHLNRSNPAIKLNSAEEKNISEKGFHVAHQMQRVTL